MKPKRYTIVVENHTTGVVRRFTLRPRPAVAALVALFALPVLFGLGIRYSARAEMQALRDAARTSAIENASYREATADLTGQITALQDTVNELSKRSVLDPELAKVMSRLPARVRSQAVGGTNDGTAVRSAMTAVMGPEDTFGMLRDLLGRLEERLQLVRSDIDRRSALASATPSMWPTHGWLSASFGQREDPFGGGSEEFHTGIDLSTEKGQPVVATARGTVEAAFFNGSYGNMVILDHGFGLKTRYAHLSGFKVKPGDKVERNAVIGYVGATGRATGPHLHYEVLVNGQLVNPIQFLGPR